MTRRANTLLADTLLATIGFAGVLVATAPAMAFLETPPSPALTPSTGRNGIGSPVHAARLQPGALTGQRTSCLCTR